MAHDDEHVAIISRKSRYTTRGQHNTTSNAGLSYILVNGGAIVLSEETKIVVLKNTAFSVPRQT